MTEARFNLPEGAGPWATISTTAIAHNLAWVKRRVGESGPGAAAPRLWAVVKADAYGHGKQYALPALDEADGVCVADLTQVSRVRALGWSKPVLVLSTWGLRADDLRDPELGELHVAVDTPEFLQTLANAPHALPGVHAWLRYAGHLRSHGFAAFEHAEAFLALRERVRTGALAGVGHMHHYATAEQVPTLGVERAGFAAAVKRLPAPWCTGNSAALCGPAPIQPHTDTHWLRCGLALYGASALAEYNGAQLGLRPAMSLRARLHSVRRVAAGETVGYGGAYRACQDTYIGLVGIGYGHGVPRNLQKCGSVLVGRADRRVPVVGRVTMESMTIDLGPHPCESQGDIVTLWGHSPSGAYLPVEEAAQSCGTIAAELLTSLTPRVPLVPH